MELLKAKLDDVVLKIAMSTRATGQREWMKLEDITDLENQTSSAPANMSIDKYEVKTVNGTKCIVRKDGLIYVYISPQIQQTLEIDFTGVEVGKVLSEKAMNAIRIEAQTSHCRKNGTAWMIENPVVKLAYDDIRTGHKTLTAVQHVMRAAQKATSEDELEEAILKLQAAKKNFGKAAK